MERERERGRDFQSHGFRVERERERVGLSGEWAGLSVTWVQRREVKEKLLIEG